MMERCRELIIATADAHGVAPVLITAHIRLRAADVARTEVYRAMITDLHLRRWQIALILKRDVRRLRRSVLGV